MISNYLKLLRFREWIPIFLFAIIGYILTKSFMPKDMLLILVAFLSFLLIGSFGYIINDYFDRESDKKKKDNRNPISTKLVSKRSAIILSLISAILGLCMAYVILPTAFPLFVALLIMFILYSTPPFRIKERFALDIFVHCLILPITFLIGFVLFKKINIPIIMLAIEFFILDIVPELLQEIRDYEADSKSRFKTTVIRLGIENSVKLTRLVMISFIMLFSLTIYLYYPLYFTLLLIPLLPMIRFVFSRDMEKKVLDINIISDVANKCVLILIPILLIIIPLWYGLI